MESPTARGKVRDGAIVFAIPDLVPSQTEDGESTMWPKDIRHGYLKAERGRILGGG
jgi:hypothetical protein